MTEIPHFSVIITAYERPGSLRRALQSVLEQSLTDFEVIVVDDGSRQPLSKVVARYGSDPRVRYIRVKNGGPGRARRLGAEAARGYWLCFLDDDDRYLPGHLAGLSMHTQSYTGLITTQMWEERSDGTSVRVTVPNPLTLGKYWAQPFSLLSFTIPRELVAACPSSNHWIIEDFEWLCRLIARYPVRVINNETVVYHHHDSNRTKQLIDRQDLICRESVVRKLYQSPEINRHISPKQYRRQLLHQRCHWVRQAVRNGHLLRGVREIPSISSIRGTAEAREWVRTIRALVESLFNTTRYESDYARK